MARNRTAHGRRQSRLSTQQAAMDMAEDRKSIEFRLKRAEQTSQESPVPDYSNSDLQGIVTKEQKRPPNLTKTQMTTSRSIA